jgi:serine/threonine protein kinase
MDTTHAGTESEAERDPIEVMAGSFLERFRCGERPSVDEYAAKYPELADEIRELLPALVQLECDLSVADGATGSCRGAPPATTVRGVPRQLGDYTILREVGRGGMGVVYEAVQQSLRRHVALKVLPWPAVGAASHLERFQLEARSAARLHHTNIVPVFGVGEAEGVHYYAMQYIHGQGLDAVIDELRRLQGVAGRGPEPAGEVGAARAIAATVARSLIGGPPAGHDAADGEATLAAPGDTAASATADAGSRSGDRASALMSGTDLTGAHDRRYYRQVARLALQVAEGLAYAHGQGVLHRDIKPSNLMVDTRGTVWITDFGLAKAEGSDGPTRTGDIVGTLRYMAPERFEGHSDRRSDVYGLGATLFELVTLRPLFGEVNRAKLVDRILHEPPTAPRRLDRRVPKDLETIVQKALAKEPAHRYGDAEAMAADLRRFIDDRPILTRRVSTSEQVWRWCRRNPAVAGLVATVLVLLVGGAIVGGLAANHFRNLAGAEKTARDRADALARAEIQAHELARRREDEARKARIEADAKASEAQAVADFLVKDLIGAASPGKGQGTHTTIGEALARADAAIDTRFAGQPLRAAAIHHQMGQTYFNLGDLVKAADHWRAAAGLRAKHLGPDARETLSSQQRLVVALRTMKWSTGGAPAYQQEARTLGEQVLERQRRALGPEDPDTLVTMGEIGQLLFPFSDDRAPEYYRKLHVALARVNGPEDVTTVNALQFYAATFHDRGDYDRSAEILRQVLALRIRGVGEVDLTTFWTMNELVQSVYLAKKYDLAWTEVERFWPVVGRNADPNKGVLQSLTDVALAVSAAKSDWARAESLFRRASQALAADLGPGHIRTLYARALLARALAERGRAEEALSVASEVLEAAPGREAAAEVDVVLEHAFAAINRAGGAGSRRDGLARRLQARAEQQITAGQPKEAISPLLLAIRLGAKDARIVDDLRQIAAKAGADDRVSGALVELGPDHPDTLTSRHNLASAYRDAGRTAEAIRLYEATLKAAESKLGPDHPDTIKSVHGLAHALESASPGRAEPLFRRALAHYRKAQGPGGPLTADLTRDLGRLLAATGRAAEGIRLLEPTLKAQEAKLGPDDPDTLGSRHNLAQAYLSAGRTAEAVPLLEGVLQAYESTLGPDHPNMAASAHLLGHALEGARPDRAEALFRRALAHYRKAQGPEGPLTLDLSRDLAGLLASTGRHAQAEPVLRDALDRARRQFGPDDLRTANLAASLGWSLLAQEKWSEAEPVLRECLRVRAAEAPDLWATFNTRSQLGGSLLGQGRYAEAEPLVVSGYEGLKAREASIPPPGRSRLPEAASRVVALYRAWGKPEQADAWALQLGLAELPADVFARP